jgi:hypothetical protein
MKQLFDIDLDSIQRISYTRVSRISRTNSGGKYNDSCPISKIDDFQSSISAFSTRIESKNNKINSNNIGKKKKKKKKRNKKGKKVENLNIIMKDPDKTSPLIDEKDNDEN